MDFPANLNGQEPETILKLAIKLNAKIECDPILHSSTEISTGGKKISFEIYDDILIGLKMWARDHNKNHLTMFTECLRFWFIPTKDAPPHRFPPHSHSSHYPPLPLPDMPIQLLIAPSSTTLSPHVEPPTPIGAVGPIQLAKPTKFRLAKGGVAVKGG